MRLLHVIRSIDPVHGGPSDSVRMFAAAHQRAGNQVEIATLDSPETAGLDNGTNANFQIPGAEVHPFGPGVGTYSYAPALESWLRANYSRFDGVIVNGIWQFHTLATRRAVAGKRPYVVFSHGMLDPYFNRRYPLKYLKKLAYWTLIERQNLHKANAVCFTSAEEQRIAAEGFPFARFRRVVVPYGTLGPEGDSALSPETCKQAFFSACAAAQGKPYLLFLGRIHPKKGCDLLLQAFAQAAASKAIAADLQLVLVGPDSAGWRAELQTLAGRLGIADRVHWTGALRGDAKWGAFYGAEAFILPSHQENFGIAVADALACGTIALLSDKVNIAPDVAADGAALVAPDSVDGTLSLIERFTAMPQAQRARMRQNARACYENRYALRNAAQQVYYALGLAQS